MSGASKSPDEYRASSMAAVMSAVEMYLQEERIVGTELTPDLGAWKTVTWQMLREERWISPQAMGLDTLSSWQRVIR